MNTIAKFELVSELQFSADWLDKIGGNAAAAKAVYASLRMPCRATAGSAGYDFFAPYSLAVRFVFRPVSG